MLPTPQMTTTSAGPRVSAAWAVRGMGACPFGVPARRPRAVHAVPRGAQRSLLVLLYLSVALGVAQGDGDQAASALFAGMPELFAAARAGQKAAPTELYATHHFAWAIAIDCRREAASSGVLAASRRLVLDHLLRRDGIAAPGDLVAIYPFGNRNLRGDARELSLVDDEYRAQLAALRDCIPAGSDITGWDTLSSRSGQVNGAGALEACAGWLASEYRRGWRHLGLIVLCSDQDELQVTASYGPQSSTQPYEAANLGLPGGSVHSRYLPGGEDVACGWLVVAPSDADAVDRISVRTGSKTIGSRSELARAALPRWGTIRGTVRDGSGQPAGQSMWVSAGRGLTAASSQSSGGYEIPVPGPGQYVVTVGDAARQTTPPMLIASLDERSRSADGLDFSVREADETETISGCVLAQDAGGAVTGGFPRLSVSLLDRTTRGVIARDRTDTSGRYGFPSLAPGGYLVRVAAAGQEQSVSCELLPGGGRMLAPMLTLPIPKPWWPLVAAAVGGAAALLVLLRAMTRGAMVVVAPAEANEGGPRQFSLGLLSRVVVDAGDDGVPQPVATITKPPFSPPRIGISHGAVLRNGEGYALGGHSASLARPLSVEFEGRAWRLTVLGRPSRHAVADPGGRPFGEPLDQPVMASADRDGRRDTATQDSPQPAQVPQPAEGAAAVEREPARPQAGRPTTDWEL